MGALFKFLKKIFFNDGLLRALPFLTLFFGVGLFIASYVALDDVKYPKLFDACKTISQAIVVSGLISVLVNSFKYMGIFKEAVHDVVFSVDHLKSRNDLKMLWSRVTSVICQEKFPQLAERLHDDVLSNYLPVGKNFFYSKYMRECTIYLDDQDQDKDVVTLHEEIDFILEPVNSSLEVPYTYRSKADSRTPAHLTRIVLHKLSIDGAEQNVGMIEEEYDDEFGGKGLLQSYVIPLKGKDRYRIRRSATRKLCITKDPVIEFSSDEFILGSVVKFRSTDESIMPVFQSVGTEDFDDRAMGPVGNWQVHREFEGLMFPNQGYMLFIQRQL